MNHGMSVWYVGNNFKWLMRITRQHILANPKVMFIFADDLSRRSYKGQGAVCAGISNCYPITTKWRCCTEESSYFHDNQFDLLVKPQIILDLQRILAYYDKYKSIVIFPKIGEGCSKLKQKSPLAYNLIQEELNKIRRMIEK